MCIAILRVHIGTRTQELVDCSADDPDVKVLIEKATHLRAVIDITVPQTPEIAGALGRLVFNKQRLEPTPIAATTEMIPALSLRLDALELSVRSQNLLAFADICFVWQVAEKLKGEVRMIKNSGNKTTNEIWEVVLKQHGLGWGMDLSSIKDQLPQTA